VELYLHLPKTSWQAYGELTSYLLPNALLEHFQYGFTTSTEKLCVFENTVRNLRVPQNAAILP
jgi:hypothetical protein